MRKVSMYVQQSPFVDRPLPEVKARWGRKVIINSSVLIKNRYRLHDSQLRLRRRGTNPPISFILRMLYRFGALLFLPQGFCDIPLSPGWSF